MNKNKIGIMIGVAVILLFAAVHYHVLKLYYEEILNSSGLVIDDLEDEVKKENERAIINNEEYQKIINPAQENEQAANPNKIGSLKLNALSSLLLDASNDRVLYEKNGYKKLAMASTTKIMTCIVALENGNMQDVVTVSAYAASMPDVQLTIRKGEQYYLNDLMYSLMLESHNDVAVAIAEHIGGSVEGFATMMNDKAREIGCYDTNFVTPNGLDAEGHYTTARDLAVIASYAIKNERFIEITNTPSHKFDELTKKRGFTVTNKNRFLYMMDGAIGVKTGFTSSAGYCFVGAIKRPDRTLVSVVLGSGWPPNKGLKWNDTKELMSYGIENYQERQICENVKLDPVLVANGQQKYEPLSMNGDIKLLIRSDEKVQIEYQIPKVIKAPVQADTVVGYARYYIDGVFYQEIPIYSKETVEKINFKFCLNKIIRLWSLNY